MDANPYLPPESEIESTPGVSAKSYGVAVSLAGVFGILGIHHFYLGRPLHGLVDLGLSVIGVTMISMGSAWGWLFLGADLIHTAVVFFMLLVGSCRDGRGLLVTYPGQKVKPNARTS